jgi:RNA polymerase sigma factor (sigma-70 family)
VDGDGAAFATLYERHEGRAFNLAYRITGSREDAADAVQEAFLGVLRRMPNMDGRELAFGSYVLTATRNACYDLIEGRRRTRPTDSIPDSATPVGGGAGGLGLDPGDPEEDPSRRQLLGSQRDEIREANARLPERQREVLALRELEGLSYDEIAAVMGMNRNSVAQLISRARINLRTELRGGALGSIAPSSPACERALPLIAKRDDGELDDDDEREWLELHLGGCEACGLRLEAMQEAGVSYRAWAPIAAAPWLFEATMARAAEQLGADWSETIAARARARGQAGERPTRVWPYATAAIAILAVVALLTAGGLDESASPRFEAEPAGRVVEPIAPAEEIASEKARRPVRESRAAPAQDEAAAPVIPVAEEAADTPPLTGSSPSRPTRSARPPASPSLGRGTGKAETPAVVTTQPAAPPAAEPEPSVTEPEEPEPETPRPTGPSKFAPNPGPPPVP